VHLNEAQRQDSNRSSLMGALGVWRADSRASPVILFSPDEVEVPMLMLEDEETHEKSSSAAQALFNLLNILLGVGTLSLPFTCRAAGWIVALIIIVVFAILTNYTAKLMKRIHAEYPGQIRSFADIGRVAFGRTGAIIFSSFLFLELFFVSALFIILMADCLAVLDENESLSKFQWAVIATLAVLPTAWLSDLSVISHLSIMGIFGIMYLIFAMVIEGAKEPPVKGIGGSWTRPQPVEAIKPIDGWPIAMGICVMGFSGHACFPSIVHSMREPEKFYKTVDTAYLIAVLFYVLVGGTGYLMFGDAVAGEVTENLMQLNKTSLRLAIFLMVLCPFTKYSLTLNPVSHTVEHHWLHLDSIPVPEGWRRVLQIVLRSTLCVVTFVFAFSVPYFEKVVSLIGTFCAFPVCIAAPCLAFLALFKGDSGVSWMERALLWLLSVGAVGLMVLGLWGTIKQDWEGD